MHIFLSCNNQLQMKHTFLCKINFMIILLLKCLLVIIYTLKAKDCKIKHERNHIISCYFFCLVYVGI